MKNKFTQFIQWIIDIVGPTQHHILYFLAGLLTYSIVYPLFYFIPSYDMLAGQLFVSYILSFVSLGALIFLKGNYDKIRNRKSNFSKLNRIAYGGVLSAIIISIIIIFSYIS